MDVFQGIFRQISQALFSSGGYFFCHAWKAVWFRLRRISSGVAQYLATTGGFAREFELLGVVPVILCLRLPRSIWLYKFMPNSLASFGCPSLWYLFLSMPVSLLVARDPRHFGTSFELNYVLEKFSMRLTGIVTVCWRNLATFVCSGFDGSLCCRCQRCCVHLWRSQPKRHCFKSGAQVRPDAAHVYPHGPHALPTLSHGCYSFGQ